MGASSSKNSRRNSNIYTPAILESFIKINEFNKYFKYQKNKGELTELFYTLIDKNNFLDGLDLEFNKIKEKKMKNKNDKTIKHLLEFILDTLHEELNEKSNKEKNEQIKNDNSNNSEVEKDESKLYQEFIDCYYKNNKSIIQSLFFGEEENIQNCLTCKTTNYNFNVFKMLYFDLNLYKKGEKRIDIRELISKYGEQEEKNNYCNKCKKTTKITSNTIIKKLPEIVIISFDNYKDLLIDYYLSFEIKEEPYLLICFIHEEKNNVFYLENNKWYEFNIKEKSQKEIDDIKKIHKNPIVAFYQKKIIHNKILMTKYYNRLSIFFNNISEIPELLKTKHIEDENIFDNYYIINKKWFNKLTKIFESEEQYQNDNLFFNSFNKVTNVPNLNIKEFKEKINLVSERVKALETEENLFPVEYNTHSDSGLPYPKDFVLVKEDDLNELIKDFNLKIKNLENNLYKVHIGEDYLFLKENNNNKVYYLCLPSMLLFKVTKILKYNEDKYYSREMKLYIKGRGGLDYYWQQRNLNLNDNKVQKIIDKEKEYIGDFINLIDNDFIYYNNANYNNNGIEEDNIINNYY
jgi:hypothetical protein